MEKTHNPLTSRTGRGNNVQQKNTRTVLKLERKEVGKKKKKRTINSILSHGEMVRKGENKKKGMFSKWWAAEK